VLSQIQAPILSKEGGRTTTKKDWNLEPSKQGDLITNPGPHCEKAAEKQHKHKGIWDVQNKATKPQFLARWRPNNNQKRLEFGAFKTRRPAHKSKPSL
jgi:hypothetical protein